MSAPGFGEIIVILIVALMVFGPRKLPEIARSVGKSVREFRRASSSLRAEIEGGVDDDEPAGPERWKQARQDANGDQGSDPADDGAPSASSAPELPDPRTGDGPD